ncbi:hypothetical protein LV779_02805 [Streptomyces thinghirensis]|nr:hypothetical protein [Streptomyces thinghirensis]
MAGGERPAPRARSCQELHIPLGGCCGRRGGPTTCPRGRARCPGTRSSTLA